MATCPHCLGPLTDNHRCPRKRHARLALTVLGAAAGATAGLVTMAAVDPLQRATRWDAWVIAASALIAAGMSYRFTRR